MVGLLVSIYPDLLQYKAILRLQQLYISLYVHVRVTDFLKELRAPSRLVVA